MEDAGATSWRGSNIGCYVGVFGGDWQDLNGKETLHRGEYRATLNEDFVLGNCVLYEFDLRGPRYVTCMHLEYTPDSIDSPKLYVA